MRIDLILSLFLLSVAVVFDIKEVSVVPGNQVSAASADGAR